MCVLMKKKKIYIVPSIRIDCPTRISLYVGIYKYLRIWYIYTCDLCTYTKQSLVHTCALGYKCTHTYTSAIGSFRYGIPLIRSVLRKSASDYSTSSNHDFWYIHLFPWSHVHSYDLPQHSSPRTKKEINLIEINVLHSIFYSS